MLSKFSVKKPYTVIVGIMLVIVLGVISFANMTTDLLPNMDLPYVAVYTTYVGGDAGTGGKRCDPAHGGIVCHAFRHQRHHLHIRGESFDYHPRFESGVDMNGVLIELSSQIDMLRGSWSDSVGAPVVIADQPGHAARLHCLRVPRRGGRARTDGLRRRNAAAQTGGHRRRGLVSVSGAVEETVSITIDEDRIELLNSLILREVDEELATWKRSSTARRPQISEGKRLLAREKSNALGQIDEALSQLSDEALSEPLAQAQAQRETLQTQLAQTEAAIAAMEALTSLTPEQQAQLDALNAQLAGLRTQRETKQRRWKRCKAP